MSRMIDADALIKKFQSDKEYFDKVGDTTFAMAAIGVIHDIEDAPTIDAVEVVRCKDCKWVCYCETDDMETYIDCDCPDGGGVPQGEEWYCADGERKEIDHE